DYEEATEIETGIDNCLLGLGQSLSGSTVKWSPSFGKSTNGTQGNESTVNNYRIWVSQDGNNLMQVATVNPPTHSFDLATLGLSGGSYQVYVEAVGQASIVNTFSPSAGTYVIASNGTLKGQV